MPKEVVHDQANLFDVEVGWNRDGTVQVGVESHDGRALVEHFTDNQPGNHIAQFTGVWGTLSRTGCNRLIKSLRKARDEAYGRDE